MLRICKECQKEPVEGCAWCEVKGLRAENAALRSRLDVLTAELAVLGSIHPPVKPRPQGISPKGLESEDGIMGR